MRTVGLVGAIGLVVGLTMPAFAAEKDAVDLFAVSQMAAVQSMTDQQLTAVEGMSYKRHHGYGPIWQSNELSQLNVNEGCKCGKRGHGGEVDQTNWAEQYNDVYGKHGSVEQYNYADQANMNFGGRRDVDQSNSAVQSNSVGHVPMIR